MRKLIPLITFFILFSGFVFADLSTNAISYWAFDTNSISQADYIGVNNGTVNGATYVTDGLLNGAYNYTPDDYIDFGAGALDIVGEEISLSVWFKADAVSSTKRIFTMPVDGRLGTGTVKFSINLESASRLQGIIATSVNIFTSETAFSDTSNWHHVVLTYNGSNQVMYLDGSLVDNDFHTGTIKANVYGGSRVGSFSDGYPQSFDGLIDEVGVWDRYFTNVSVLSLYNSGVGFNPFALITITLADYNVTNLGVLNEDNRTAWNSNGTVIVKNNLLTGTFTTNVNTNCSVSLYDVNYISMVGLDSDYKLATTETTSHSFTLKDDLKLGENCVYVSCIQESGLEVEFSDSGCLNVDYQYVYTSFGVGKLPVSDFVFTSTDWTEVKRVNFNVSYGTEYGFFTAFNLEKLNLPQSVNIYARMLIDDVIVRQELVRSVSTNLNQGSTSISPYVNNLSVGSHNISFEFRKGSVPSSVINVSNFDLVVIQLADGNSGSRFYNKVEDVKLSFDSSSYTNIYDFNNSFGFPSGHFDIFTYKIIDTSGLFEAYLSDVFNSSFTKRSIGSTTGAGMFGFRANFSEDAFSNSRLYARESSVGSLSINGSHFMSTARTEYGNIVKAVSLFNDSINLDNPLAFGIGKTPVFTGEFTSFNSSIGLFAYASITGGGNVVLSVESDTGCNSIKKRDFAVGVSGIVYLYDLCSVDHGNFTLYITSTGSGVFNDGGVSLFSAIPISFGEGNVAPFSGVITNPLNNTIVTGEDVITWSNFLDPNGNMDYYSVMLYNDSGSFNLGNTTFPNSSLGVDWGGFANGFYDLTVWGFDEFGLNASVTHHVENLNFTYDFSVISPDNGSVVVGGGSYDFVFNLSTTALCSFVLDGVTIESVEVSSGFNTFSYVFPNVNASYNWSVGCSAGGLSLSSVARVFGVVGLPVVSDYLSGESCPSSTSDVLLLFLIMGSLISLLVVSVAWNVNILGFFVSFGFVLFGLLFMVCHALFGWLFVVLGVLLFVIFIICLGS